MAMPDEILGNMIDGLSRALATAGLVRQRGGTARGIAWVECSGRLADGSWGGLRLHHRPSEQRLQAGLLLYQPLSRGGRTVPIGDQSRTYCNGPSEVAEDLADDVRGWLGLLGGQR